MKPTSRFLLWSAFGPLALLKKDFCEDDKTTSPPQKGHTMTPEQIARHITDLQEVRGEIRRINEAASRTVFNPAATQALEAVIAALQAEGK